MDQTPLPEVLPPLLGPMLTSPWGLLLTWAELPSYLWEWISPCPSRFLLCCPSPGPSSIWCPSQDDSGGPRTSRLLSEVRSWHWLLSRHQPRTSMKAWSSRASSRAPERLQHDLGIFQAGGGSAEANKIGGTPARSRTMLATHQEGPGANINNTIICGPQGFLRTGAVQGEGWCAGRWYELC